jgi:hypothetical protein
MSYRTFKSFLGTAALLGSLVLAPAAQAVDRNTGVGLEIAAQGNQALQTIRAEQKAAVLHLLKPALPKAHVTKVSAPAAHAAGAMFIPPTTVRCAE